MFGGGRNPLFRTRFQTRARAVEEKEKTEGEKMKVLIRLSTAADSVAALITNLEKQGHVIVNEDDLPDIVITDDPILFLWQRGEVVKFFINQPSSPRNIAIGVTCFTSAEMLRWIVGRRTEA